MWKDHLDIGVMHYIFIPYDFRVEKYDTCIAQGQ